MAKILSESMNPIITRRDPWTTRSEHAEDVMAEFGQIFDYNLTVSLYIYGSLACLAVASAAATASCWTSTRNLVAMDCCNSAG